MRAGRRPAAAAVHRHLQKRSASFVSAVALRTFQRARRGGAPAVGAVPHAPGNSRVSQRGVLRRQAPGLGVGSRSVARAVPRPGVGAGNLPDIRRSRPRGAHRLKLRHQPLRSHSSGVPVQKDRQMSTGRHWGDRGGKSIGRDPIQGTGEAHTQSVYVAVRGRGRGGAFRGPDQHHRRVPGPGERYHRLQHRARQRRRRHRVPLRRTTSQRRNHPRPQGALRRRPRRQVASRRGCLAGFDSERVGPRVHRG
mmetsp:Transcript_2099/g.9523  ORF Transcript_2099/g.9523 Transcript_2099/m.9523 type:complete len:251 (+) Transcript_2099:2278-3030(+)